MAVITAGLAIEHYTGKAMTVLYALAAWLAVSVVLGLVLGRLLRRRAAAYPELADTRERLHSGTSDADLDEMAHNWGKRQRGQP